MSRPKAQLLSWTSASPAEVRTGLLAFISIRYGDLLLDDIVLRKTTSGRFALSFPARTSRSGKRHAIVRPIDDAARHAIEREILGQLGQREEVV